MTKSEVFVVPHTHWDREWYFSYEKYHLRLLKLMDCVISLIREGSLPHFHLDGQTVLLEDYLAVKPHMSDAIKQLIRKKKLSVGPWYVLMDEFSVSEESILRNLLIGMKQALSFGQTEFIGYLPDQFGHISQMPTILKKAGIDRGILWRGRGDAASKNLFIWKAPSGASVLMYQLPPVGYGTLMGLTGENLVECIEKALALEKKRSIVPVYLLMYGCDHLFPDPEMIRRLKDEFKFKISSLMDYFREIASYKCKIEVEEGELRRGELFFFLGGTLSNRVHIKMSNYLLEKKLLNIIEPLLVFLKKYKNIDRSQELEYAWKNLIKNHPHDSIAACSVDEVVEDVENRFKRVEEFTDALLNDSLEELFGFSICEQNQPEVSYKIINPYLFRIDSPLIVELFVPWQKIGGLKILDEKGNPVEFQVLSFKSSQMMKPWLHKLPSFFEGKTLRIALRTAIEPLSSRTITLKKLNISEGWFYKNANVSVKNSAIISNGKLELDVSDGCLNVKIGRQIYKDLLYFLDSIDVGDEYNYSWPMVDKMVFSRFNIKKLSLNSLHSMVSIIELSGNISAVYGHIPAKLRIELRENSNWIDFELHVKNTVSNHRMVLLINLPVKRWKVMRLSHFDYCRVLPADFDVDKLNKYNELDPTLFPHRGFIRMEKGPFNVSVIAPGLLEGIILPNGIPGIVLYRSVDKLSKNDLLSRKVGHGGYPLNVPGALYMNKILKFKFRILFDESIENALRHWKVYPFEIIAFPGKNAFNTDIPLEVLTDCIIGAFKPEADFIILRVYNPFDRAKGIKFISGATSVRIFEADFFEKPIRLLSKTPCKFNVPRKDFRVFAIPFEDLGKEV